MRKSNQVRHKTGYKQIHEWISQNSDYVRNALDAIYKEDYELYESNLVSFF